MPPKDNKRPRRTPLAPPPPPIPPLARDPWAWAATLAVLPLVALAWFPFVGEPVADDIDFLHHAFFGGGSLLDGGGSRFYWRPLARQVYYRAFGGLMLDHPAVVAGLQAVAAALASLLLYRALRRRWPGPLAASAASFPLLIESARALISWPTNFQDLGAVLFAALALHEAAYRRLPTALAGLLASLLCKEMGVVAAALLPWMAPEPMPRRERWRWIMGVGAILAAWGGVYLWVVRHAGQLFARDFFSDPVVLATPWIVRYPWACAQAAADAFSLSGARPPWDGACQTGLLAVGVAAAVVFLASREARARLLRWLPVAGIGVAWFLGTSATLADVYPDWRPYRSIFGIVGLGVACTALLGAASPRLLAGLLLVRLAAMGASPLPPRAISPDAPRTPYTLDYTKLVRLQRLVGETHRTLVAHHPRLPSHSYVVRHYMPRQTFHGFVGDVALHVWYRDSTLRWLSYEDLRSVPFERVAAMVEYQPAPPRQMVMVDLEAALATLEGAEMLERASLDSMAVALDRADSLQTDRGARVLLGIVAGKRAILEELRGRHVEAEREALRGLALWRENSDTRYVLGYEWNLAGKLEQAQAQIETLLTYYPEDTSARQLLQHIRTKRLARGLHRR